MAVIKPFCFAAITFDLCVSLCFSDPPPPNRDAKLIDAEFKSADANGDGRISLREFAFYVAYYRSSVLQGLKGSLALSKVSSEFKKANVTGTGYLSPKEFAAYFAKASPGTPDQNPNGWAAKHDIVEEPAKPADQPKDDAVSATIAKYVTIHKSFLSGIDKDASDPAQFNWAKASGQDSSYSMDLAVSLQKDYTLYARDFADFLGYRWTPFLNGIFEAHISTVPKSAQDDIQYQGLIEFLGRADNDHNFVQAHHLYIRPMYETDRVADVRQARVDIDYTPDLDIFAWGQTKPIAEAQIGDFKPLGFLPKDWTFYWRPVIGMELHSIDTGLSVVAKSSNLPNLEDDYGFFRVRLQAQVNLSDRFVFTLSWVNRTDLYGKAGDHNYVELTGLWTLDPDQHYSIGVTYKRGEDSSKFEDLDVVSAFVGVQF